MRVLMFGRGVISTIYGHALQEAGHDVEFHVRKGRAEQFGDEVVVDLIDARRSPLGMRSRLAVPTRLRESVGSADGFELVVLSVGHHHLEAAAEFLAPRIGDATVLVLGNVWDEPLAAVEPIPATQVVFGFPQAGGGFDDDGVLRGALMRTLIVGRSDTAPSARQLAVRGAFLQAGFTIREEKDMRGWLWLHFIADVGMHAQGHRHGGLANMIGDRRALRDAFLITRELLPVIQARGVDLRRHRRAILPFRLPAQTSAALAWASTRFAIAQVSLAAHTDPDAPEPRAVIRDALLETRRLGIPTPRLDAALSSEGVR
ncbi:ketopantoate reductase family protein [Microbacterium murale]|uniref:2-dehydropantoate 2-reductase n=1 Tax=Microbacterium murale TaxID=1081040 RepID=A0ABU0P9U2_9MICO|nr:2-dehydropantoate 2-reductase N-terminal domain-containing protein [Microbacterium murale]MDQ0644088.1 2-dehydropantoate 2-reductase [Microbacterium murale]